MKNIWILILCLFTSLEASSQKYISEKSHVSFFSEAPMENIKAQNNKATAVFDMATGEIAFSVPIKSFQFEKSLMQEHFNENYLESDKYPVSTFRGKIDGFQKKEGVQEVEAIGSLSIHGVSKNVKVKGKMEMKDGKLMLNAKFPVALADYDITIPQIVFYNIAEVVAVSLDFQFKPYDK